MSANIKWTKDLDDQIIDLHINCKMPLTKISDKLNISKPAISRRLKKLGYDVINYQNQHDWTIDAIQEYLNLGYSKSQIAKIYNISEAGITKICKKHKLTTIPSFNEHVFDVIDNEEKAYWLGFLYADGSISSQKSDNKSRYVLELTLSAKDIHHLEKFNTFMKHNEYNIKYREKVNAYRWSVNNKHLWETLNSYGCVPNKSLILKFPNKRIFTSKELIIHFIRGYFDGDGCISRNLSSKSVSPDVSLLGTHELLTTIKNIINKEDIDCDIKRNKKYGDHNVWTLSFKKEPGIKFINLIYNDSAIYLDRKYKLYQFFKNGSRSIQEWTELLSTKNGEVCDDNTVVTEEIKESSAPYSVETETDISE